MTYLSSHERVNLAHRIFALTEPSGSCRLWRGAGWQTSKPRVWCLGRAWDARRALVFAVTGELPQRFMRWEPGCGNALCVASGHLRYRNPFDGTLTSLAKIPRQYLGNMA